MEEKILNLIREMISLDEWKFAHVRIGTPSGTTEFFFANPNQLKEEKTDQEKQEDFMKENPNGLIVDDNGIKVD